MPSCFWTQCFAPTQVLPTGNLLLPPFKLLQPWKTSCQISTILPLNWMESVNQKLLYQTQPLPKPKMSSLCFSSDFSLGSIDHFSLCMPHPSVNKSTNLLPFLEQSHVVVTSVLGLGMGILTTKGLEMDFRDYLAHILHLVFDHPNAPARVCSKPLLRGN